MNARVLLCTCVLTVGLTEAAEAAKGCKRLGRRPQVFIKSKTPVRRGPGLNYPVSTFLDRGKCAPFTEISIDREWVLVDVKSTLGWVPRTRLSSTSQKTIAKAGVGDSAPVGSGQERGFVEAVSQTQVMRKPSRDGAPKVILPEGTRFVPLSKSSDDLWIEVRDSRGDLGWVLRTKLKGEALKGLPMSTAEFGNEVVGSGGGSTTQADGLTLGISRAGPTRSADSLTFITQVYGAALAPVHSLKSNGAVPVHTYDLQAIAGGGGIEVQITDIGPITIRMGYQIGVLSNLKAEDNDVSAVGGMQHDVQGRIGLSLGLGPLLVTPEVGYALAIFDFDAELPTQPAQAQRKFVSSQSQYGLVGLKLDYFISSNFVLEADGAVQIGATVEGPENVRLGTPGVALGGIAGIGGQVIIGENIGLFFRYSANYRKTSFDGPAALDQGAMITESTLTDFSHGVLVGAMFWWAPNNPNPGS